MTNDRGTAARAISRTRTAEQERQILEVIGNQGLAKGQVLTKDEIEVRQQVLTGNQAIGDWRLRRTSLQVAKGAGAGGIGTHGAADSPVNARGWQKGTVVVNRGAEATKKRAGHGVLRAKQTLGDGASNRILVESIKIYQTGDIGGKAHKLDPSCDFLVQTSHGASVGTGQYHFNRCVNRRRVGLGIDTQVGAHSMGRHIGTSGIRLQGTQEGNVVTDLKRHLPGGIGRAQRV